MMKYTNDSNSYIDWIEKAIDENYIKYYDYAGFNDVKEISSGSVGNIFRAKWKGSDTIMVLKSSYKLSIKEVVNEVMFVYTLFKDGSKIASLSKPKFELMKLFFIVAKIKIISEII